MRKVSREQILFKPINLFACLYINKCMFVYLYVCHCLYVCLCVSNYLVHSGLIEQTSEVKVGSDSLAVPPVVASGDGWLKAEAKITQFPSVPIICLTAGIRRSE